MTNTFEEKYYKDMNKKFNNIGKIGNILGELQVLKIDVKWKDDKEIQKKITKIYNKLNEIEL